VGDVDVEKDTESVGDTDMLIESVGDVDAEFEVVCVGDTVEVAEAQMVAVVVTERDVVALVDTLPVPLTLTLSDAVGVPVADVDGQSVNVGDAVTVTEGTSDVVMVGDALDDEVVDVDTLEHGDELCETVVDRVNEADELELEHAVGDGDRVPVVLDVVDAVPHAETLDVVDEEGDTVVVKFAVRDVHAVAVVECDGLALGVDETDSDVEEEEESLGDAVADREIVAHGDAEFERVPDAVTETVADGTGLEEAGALIVTAPTELEASTERDGGATDGETVDEPECDTVAHELGVDDTLTVGDCVTLAHAVNDGLTVPDLEIVGEPELDAHDDGDVVSVSDAVVVHTTETVLALYVHDTLGVGEVVIEADTVGDVETVAQSVTEGESEAVSVVVAHAVDVIEDEGDPLNDVDTVGENEPDVVPHDDGVELADRDVVTVLDCDAVSHGDREAVPQKLPDVE
jgi:hypothetical protein